MHKRKVFLTRWKIFMNSVCLSDCTYSSSRKYFSTALTLIYPIQVFYSHKINELIQSSQAGDFFFNSTSAKKNTVRVNRFLFHQT